MISHARSAFASLTAPAKAGLFATGDALRSQAARRRQLHAIKREQYPWLRAVPNDAPQRAIIPLDQAFQTVFSGRARSPSFRLSATISRVAERWPAIRGRSTVILAKRDSWR